MTLRNGRGEKGPATGSFDGIRRWARRHLFPSAAGTVLTVFSALVVVLFLRGMLGWAFAGVRRWEAVATNLRLLMTHAYPEDQYVRIWVSLGVVAALGGGSLALWRPAGRVSIDRLLRLTIGVGGALLFCAVVALGRMPSGWTIAFVIGGALLTAGGILVRSWAGRRRPNRDVAVTTVGAVAVTLVVAGLWVIPFGRYGYADGVFIADPWRTIALSTKLPWTVVAGVLFVSYRIGRALGGRLPVRPIRWGLAAAWLLSVAVIPLVILRAPDLAAWDLRGDAVVFLAAAAGGALILLLITGPDGGDAAGVGAAIGFGAYGLWPVSMPLVVRLLALLFAGFALASGSFSGSGRRRRRYALIWAAGTAPVIFLTSMGAAGTTLEYQATSFLGGFALTLALAVVAIMLSFPLGLIMALGRGSTLPIFRIVSAAYIDAVRGMPFLIVLIFADRLLGLLLPRSLSPDAVVLALIAFTLYFSAYMAENVRGGLQAIPLGQYEASRALGMSPLQITTFVVLPQALRAVIPALVGQAIVIFKETSLVSVVVIWDLLFIASKVVPQQSAFIGSMRENLLFAAGVYWLFSFTFSRASLRIERRLGLGEESHYGAL